MVQLPLRGTVMFGPSVPASELAGYYRLSLRDKRPDVSPLRNGATLSLADLRLRAGSEGVLAQQ